MSQKTSHKKSRLLINEWSNCSMKCKKEKIKELKKYFHLKTFSQFTIEAHYKVFSEIDCLDCAHCCKNLPPIINETDVNRIARFLKMRPTDFKANYVSYDEDDDMILNLTPCVFLLADNTCKVYEVRPRACREYPHTGNGEFRHHMILHEKNILFCPAVFQIVKEIKVRYSLP